MAQILNLNQAVGYKGNQNLVKAGYIHPFTQHEQDEFEKCRDDVVYFARTYIKIVNVDRGLMNFELWPYQEELLRSFTDHRFVICKFPRQTGKTSCVVAWILHFILFNKNVHTAILANKGATAREILGRLQLAYEWLPKWLQQGATVWNKGDIELANGSKVLSAATSSDAVRGYTFNCVDGNSEIVVRIDGIEQRISMKSLFDDGIANSSRYSKNINDDTTTAWVDRKYVSEKQIHDLVLSDGEQGLSKRSGNERTSSYYPKEFGWNKCGVEFSFSSNPSPYHLSQTSDSDDRRTGEKENDIRPVHDDTYSDSRLSKHSRGQVCKASRINSGISNWEDSLRGDETENIDSESESRSTVSLRGDQKEAKYVRSWKEKNKGTFGQNKQESGKDSEDGRETSWNEKNGREPKKNESGCLGQNSVEQRKKEHLFFSDTPEDAPGKIGNQIIEVLTEKGFRRFVGMKKTKAQKTIRLSLVDDKDIICTEDHKIFTRENGYLEAKACLDKHALVVDGSYIKISNISEHEVMDVYDFLEIEETHSYYCNDILVHQCIFFDEFAFIPGNVAEQFFNSVYPTISSGKKSKVFIVSTPNGMNKFYKMWTDAKNKESDYFPVEVNWWDVPGRDQKWKEQTIRNTSKRQWNQEFECSFLGSSNTLIDGDVLARLTWSKPISESNDSCLAIWNRPIDGHTYALVADVAHGQGLDYSTFHVIDVTSVPYKQVARYRSNLISPLVFPTLIARVGTEYNDAYVMIEVNDIGAQVADILHHELAYENLIKMQKKQGGAGQQQVSGGYGSGKKVQLGIKTSTSTKRLGCANIKTLIEQDKLIIQDYETVKELTTFISSLQSFAAEPGQHDDLAMALVQFGWLAAQRYFREASQPNAAMDIRAALEKEHLEGDESEQLFFGIIDNGDQSSDEGGFFLQDDEYELDAYGEEIWKKIPDKGQGVPVRKKVKDPIRSFPDDAGTEEVITRSFPQWFEGDKYRSDKLWPDFKGKKELKR